MSVWSCVCIYRLRPDQDEEGGYIMIKVVDDPFCPAHHADEMAEPL
jgi:hypothetical protein